MKEIPLTQGMVALVSDEDYEKVSQYKWCASLESRGTKWYAVRRRRKDECPIKWKSWKIRMHHFILDKSPHELNGLVIDHQNDNGLDNTRENLKEMSQDDNMKKVAGWKRKK